MVELSDVVSVPSSEPCSTAWSNSACRSLAVSPAALHGRTQRVGLRRQEGQGRRGCARRDRPLYGPWTSGYTAELANRWTLRLRRTRGVDMIRGRGPPPPGCAAAFDLSEYLSCGLQKHGTIQNFFFRYRCSSKKLNGRCCREEGERALLPSAISREMRKITQR